MKRVLNLMVFVVPLIVMHSSPSFGQESHYFLDNARWVYQTVESYEPGQASIYSGLEENIIDGDTILNGVVYNKLFKRFTHSNTIMQPFPNQGITTFSYESKGPMFIRFKAIENKVFLKETADSSEGAIWGYTQLYLFSLHGYYY